MPASDRQPSKPLTDDEIRRLLRARPHGDHLLTEQVQAVMRYHFQQSINCCQTTAVAYALSALGFPTSPDDIFWAVEVDVDTAVHEGMTLAETHELALRYITAVGLPVFVDAYHFDEGAQIDEDALWQACTQDADNGADDVLALNFHSGIAHGWPSGGGGHFALLVATLPETRELIVSDVHPLKYGAHWSASARQLLAAMQDKDTSVGRARGLLRFGLHGKGLVRPIGSLARANRVVDWTAPPDPYLGDCLQAFVPKRWFSYMGARNMEGMSALALACGVLDEPSSRVSSLDAIMRGLRESYTGELNRFCDAGELHGILQRLQRRGSIRSEPSLAPLSRPLDASALRNALKSVDCGSASVAVMVPFDVSVAYGADMRATESAEANVLSHGTKSWGLLAAYDPDADDDCLGGLVVAAAHATTTHGRLWRCSLDGMAKAIAAVGGDRLLVLKSGARVDEDSKLNALLDAMDATKDGTVDAAELSSRLTAEGFTLSVPDAQALIREASRTGTDRLTRTQAVELFVRTAGMHPDHAQTANPRSAAIREYLAAHGSIPNELGFATVHLALQTADIPACAKFYNNVVGWPLYKTVDRGHAGADRDALGSSWASFGAFASFIVFHLEDVPIGRVGHGPWASDRSTPAGLLGDGGQRSIAFEDIPFPMLGVVLEPGFYDVQMQRIADKDASVRWLEVQGVRSLFGGSEVASAVVFRDPDGYPLVFFVSTLTGADYRARFPCTPFVYGTDIKAAYPSPEEEAKKKAADAAWIASCPTIARYRASDETKPKVHRWLDAHAYGKDSLQQHRAYYANVPRCEKLREVDDHQAKVVQLEYEWDKHFMILRTNREHDGALLSSGKQDHDMGGNKGRVPVPHFGVNTSLEEFAADRERVTQAMKRHGVPLDMCTSLSAMGHAPPYNALDSYDLLFPRDPDSCLSMLCCDPGGNMNEIKFYLDFGEMFHGSGSVGTTDIEIDNSMAELHFPPAVLAMLEKRSLRGDADGREISRQRQDDLVERGIVDED